MQQKKHITHTTQSNNEFMYWSNVCISVSQVFFGITAATFFVGEFDVVKVIVIILNLIYSILFWIIGWRILV